MSNTTIGTPSNIEVLLHFHTNPEPHPRLDAPAVRDAVLMLLDEEAIYSFKDGYRTTAKGRAWVQALCNVPPPRVAYIDESGKPLGD